MDGVVQMLGQRHSNGSQISLYNSIQFYIASGSSNAQNGLTTQKKCANKVDIAFVYEVPNIGAASTFKTFRQIVEILNKVSDYTLCSFYFLLMHSGSLVDTQ